MKTILIAYSKESAQQAAEAFTKTDWQLDGKEVIVARITGDIVVKKVLKIIRGRGDEIEKLYIYGDQINDGVLKLAIAAFVAGIPVTRRAFRWRLQPVCRGCEWRQNAGNTFRGTGNTC